MKINILQLVNGFAIGGGEIKLLELVKLLDKDKFNQVVVSVGQSGPLQKEFEELGFPVYVFEKKHKYDFTQIYKVRGLIKKHNIDIVMTTLFYADVIGAFASKGHVPVISWEVVTQPQKTVHKLTYGRAKKHFYKVITVSNAIKDKIIKERNLVPEKVDTIHYGVDTQRFIRDSIIGEKIKKELGIENGKIILGTVARLTNQKGHKYLIEAVPQIVEKYPNVKFVFAGDGYLHEELNARIKGLGMSSYFIFLGFRKDIPELLSAFDGFILPSLYEGLPNVVLEAMSCSNPVVATAVDGTPEAVIDGETGFLVPSKQPEPLAKAVIKLIQNKTNMETMGQNGRLRVEKHFSIDKQVEEFEYLFHQVLHKAADK